MSLWRSTLVTICPFYTSSLISIILLWCVRHGTTTDRYLIWSDKLSFHFTIQSDISRMGKFPVLVKHATATPLSILSTQARGGEITVTTRVQQLTYFRPRETLLPKSDDTMFIFIEFGWPYVKINPWIWPWSEGNCMNILPGKMLMAGLNFWTIWTETPFLIKLSRFPTESHLLWNCWENAAQTFVINGRPNGDKLARFIKWKDQKLVQKGVDHKVPDHKEQLQPAIDFLFLLTPLEVNIIHHVCQPSLRKLQQPHLLWITAKLPMSSATWWPRMRSGSRLWMWRKKEWNNGEFLLQYHA